MTDFLVIGTGEGVLHYREKIKELNKTCKTLAFQLSYPYIYTIQEPLNIRLDGWFWSDPHAAMPGLEYIMEHVEEYEDDPSLLGDFKIYLPEFQGLDHAEWRSYCGSTPLERDRYGWKKYMADLNTMRYYNLIEVVPGTTTKYPEYKLRKKDIFSKKAKDRFEYNKVIFGSVPFDSEQVFSDGRFKWGMESKLSSYVLPMCHKLGAKRVYFAGLGMVGGRLYDPSKTTIPAKVGNGVQFALDVIEMWSKDWKEFHGMELISVEDDDWSLVKKIL